MTLGVQWRPVATMPNEKEQGRQETEGETRAGERDFHMGLPPSVEEKDMEHLWPRGQGICGIIYFALPCRTDCSQW